MPKFATAREWRPYSLPLCGTISFLSGEAGAGEDLGQNPLHRHGPFPGVGGSRGVFITGAQSEKVVNVGCPLCAQSS